MVPVPTFLSNALVIVDLLVSVNDCMMIRMILFLSVKALIYANEYNHTIRVPDICDDIYWH